MDNNTKAIRFQEEKNDFEHPIHINVTMSIMSILIIISMFVITRRLFKFFRRPNRRFLDQIVHFQMAVTIVVAVLTLLFLNSLIWVKTLKDYVTELGCYIGPYIFYFTASYTGLHSFFIALFRYICILHPDRLSNSNISPEVRQK